MSYNWIWHPLTCQHNKYWNILKVQKKSSGKIMFWFEKMSKFQKAAFKVCVKTKDHEISKMDHIFLGQLATEVQRKCVVFSLPDDPDQLSAVTEIRDMSPTCERDSLMSHFLWRPMQLNEYVLYMRQWKIKKTPNVLIF